MQCNTQCNTARQEQATLLKDQQDLKASWFQVHIEDNGTRTGPHTVHVSPNVCKCDRAEFSIKIIYDAHKWHPLE